MPNRQETLYKDFSARLEPRPLWNSQRGATAIRTPDGYRRKTKVAKIKKPLTEARDNAIGRAIRRRQNKRMRGWLPYAQR